MKKLFILVALLAVATSFAGNISRRGTTEYHNNVGFNSWGYGTTGLAMVSADVNILYADSATAKGFFTTSLRPKASVNSTSYDVIQDSVTICVDAVGDGADDIVVRVTYDVSFNNGTTWINHGGNSDLTVTGTRAIQCVKRQFFPTVMHRVKVDLNSATDAGTLFNVRAWASAK